MHNFDILSRNNSFNININENKNVIGINVYAKEKINETLEISVSNFVFIWQTKFNSYNKNNKIKKNTTTLIKSSFPFACEIK